MGSRGFSAHRQALLGGVVFSAATAWLAPPAEAQIVVNSAVTVPGTQSSPWGGLNVLLIGDGGTGSVAISAGGIVAFLANSLGYSAGSSGTVTVTGAGSSFLSTFDLTVGDAGTGLLIVSDGGLASGSDGYVGMLAGSTGTVTITGAGSEWSNATSLYVGNAGTGMLNIEAGGKVAAINSYVGGFAGASGTVTVTGEDSTWTNTGEIGLGQNGTGVLNVEAGGQVTSVTSYVGVMAGATGTATVTGTGSKWATTGAFYVGFNGTGTLNIEDGGLVTSASAYLGFNPGSSGTATVTGAGSAWNITGEIGIGQFSTGTLTISDGGTLTNASGYIGVNAGVTGSATVTGTNSVWTNSTALFVGFDGTGTLTVGGGGSVSGATTYIGTNNGGIGALNVQAGGSASADDAYVGVNIGGTGTVTVGGTGATWTIANDLVIGGSSTGTLTVNAGGAVISGNGYVGLNPAAVGTATVTGAGATWSTGAMDLFVGLLGDGTLTIADGGAVSSGITYVGYSIVGGGAVELNGTSGSRGSLTTGQVVKGSGAGTLTFDGGVLVAAGDQADLISGFHVGEVTIDAGGAFIDTNGHTVGLQTALSGVGGLTKLGTGVLTLDGVNLYQGGTTVSGGTLRMGSLLALPLLSDVTIDAGATLDLNGYGAALHSLSGAGTLETGSEGAVFLFHGGTFAGSITGANGGGMGPAAFLFFAPGETLTLSGNSDFGGLLAIGDGTIVSTGISSFGGLTLLGGTFEVAGGATTINSEVVVGGYAGTPEITVSGGGTLTLTHGLYLADCVCDGGEVVVTGAGSALNVGGELYVAYDGVGQLIVSGGAVAINGGAGTIELASGTDGMGTLVIGAASGDPATAPGVVKAASVGASGGAGTVLFNHNSGAYYFTSDGTAAGTPVLITQNVDPDAGGTGQTSVTVEAGTTYLLAANDYTGLTTINGGMLSIGDGGTSGSIVGEALINAGGTLQFARADDVSYAGTLSGTGSLVKAGAGALNYTGDGSAFTGLTTVAVGTLSVNGTLGGPVDVLAGGTLGGNGTMGSVTLLAGGTASPGNSIGTLHVAGDVTFNSGSFYQVELAGNGTSDLIAATGQAIVNGGTVVLTAIDPQTSYQTGQTYLILTAAGGVTGAFDAAVSQSIFLNVRVDDLLDGVGVTIAVERDLDTVAQTPNQYATAGALDTLAQSGAPLALYNSLLFLSSAEEARWAFDQLSGEVHASAQSVFMEQSSLIRGALNDRLRAAQGGVGAAAGSVVSVVETADGALAYAAPSKVQLAADMSMPLKATPAQAPAERFALWTTGFGNWGAFDGNANAAGINDSTGGFLIGADTLVGEGWRVGVAGGYSYTDFSIAGRNASGTSDNWHAGLYAGRNWDALALRTGLAYTWQDVSTARAVAFSGFADSLSADYTVGTFQAFGELGYRIDTTFASLEPFANLAYVSLDTDGYAETGGTAALYSDGADMETTFTTLGLRVAKDVQLGAYAATLRGAVGWRHAFGDITPAISQAFLASDAFTVTGVPIAENAAVLEAGLDVRVGAATTLGIAYTGQFGDGVQQNGFNASLKVSF